MKITQIRNATNKLYYGNTTFLIDPWLAPKHTLYTAAMEPQLYHLVDPVMDHMAMPFYDLPMTKEDILSHVDFYIVTHLHPDHIDVNVETGTIGDSLDKTVPVICQNKEDASLLKNSGFIDVTILTEQGLTIGTTTLHKTPCRHGVIKPSGEAMGVVFTNPSEKTLYLAGDTILYEGVYQSLATYAPNVIMLNACAAEMISEGRLIMNDEDVAAIGKLMPDANLYLTHMDNVAHATLTRHTMRSRLLFRRVDHYDMPDDGETISY
ncbi:MAG: MBL fold metallo-hydrolase [Megasphaera sp.]|jgi:L-ascorbate metabolism protein UlaG (beta-lactamase superfamily)|nr:MBL fold metallo-hydrolase [Megasphaera sp.]